MGTYDGGLLKVALRGNGASSLPLEQCPCTPQKILGPTVVPLKMIDFHFTCKIGELDYFLVFSSGVFQNFDFIGLYDNLKRFFLN